MEPRSPSSDDHYALMEAGLKLSPNYADGWRILGALTQADPPPPDQLNYWIELLDRLCGREYPDFFVEAIDPIIASVEDPKARVDAWEWVFRRVERTRPDLAALARVRQGEVFEAEGKAHNAWIAYDEVLNRFANQGPFIAEALAKQEAMLTAAGKTRDIAPMYERVWARIDRPQASASQFLRGSTWYRVGSMYARALARVGDDPAAARVRGVLGDS